MPRAFPSRSASLAVQHSRCVPTMDIQWPPSDNQKLLRDQHVHKHVFLLAPKCTSHALQSDPEEEYTGLNSACKGATNYHIRPKPHEPAGGQGLSSHGAKPQLQKPQSGSCAISQEATHRSSSSKPRTSPGPHVLQIFRWLRTCVRHHPPSLMSGYRIKISE